MKLENNSEFPKQIKNDEGLYFCPYKKSRTLFSTFSFKIIFLLIIFIKMFIFL